MDHSRTLRPTRWLAISALLPIGVLFATAGVMSIPRPTGDIDVIVGRDLFRAHCGSCHFAKVGFPAHHGPNLHEIGRTSPSRKPDQTGAEYILESILDPAAFIAPNSRPGMPKNIAGKLAPGEIRNIVGFLASCGAFPDYNEIMQLEIPDKRIDRQPITVNPAKMKLAEDVLRDKGSCLQCHSLYSVPESMVFAPGLFGVGHVDRELVKQSILHPAEVISPAFRNVKIVLDSGKILSGRLIHRTAERLTLLMRDQQNQLVRNEVPVSAVDREEGQPLILESQETLMPAGYDQLLTEEELEALITLIQQLN